MMFYFAEHLRIKSFIAINKNDLNPEFQGVKNFSEENNVEIIGRIPYDKTVARLMAHRRPLAEYYLNNLEPKAIKDIASFVESLMT